MQGEKQYHEKLFTNFQLREHIPQENFMALAGKFNFLNCNDNVVFIVIRLQILILFYMLNAIN